MSRISCGHSAHLHLVIASTTTPQVQRHCAGCKAERPFASSGKFRVNAQKKLIDVWLIYRCSNCDQTWNHPIHERQKVKSLSPGELNALMQNDAALATRYAHDLGRGVAGEVFLERRILQPATEATQEIRVSIAVPAAGIRLDRALALGLSLQRAEVQTLVESGSLTLRPNSAKALRRPVQDGQEVTIDLARCPPELVGKCRRTLMGSR
ncbi:DUF1062 domain-containing protein [Dongia sp.]|uniref:DUF1062 domain-containing protein n=1 Tax=Dongia sp. TaxID=1977262 RepID=UPI0035B33A76